VRRLETLASESATLQAYLKAIAQFPRLTPEEEQGLAWRAHLEADPDARQRLVESNLRFVVSYAKRYRHLGVGLLDLIHEGNLGLIEASRRFDPSRHVKFITYAVWWVRQSIMHILSESSRVDVVPAKVAGAASRFGRQVEALRASLDHRPTTEEVADELDMSDDDVRLMVRLQGTDSPLSEPVFQDDDDRIDLEQTLADGTGDLDDEPTREALVDELDAALADLSAREQEVMRMRYGLHGGEPCTLDQIGERLNTTPERIRQIESLALRKLRRRKSLRSFLN
jgi:RNA polymerase primary sigma factor